MEEHGINERKQRKRGEKRRGIKREECDIKAERDGQSVKNEQKGENGLI